MITCVHMCCFVLNIQTMADIRDTLYVVFVLGIFVGCFAGIDTEMFIKGTLSSEYTYTVPINDRSLYSRFN